MSTVDTYVRHAQLQALIKGSHRETFVPAQNRPRGSQKPCCLDSACTDYFGHYNTSPNPLARVPGISPEVMGTASGALAPHPEHVFSPEALAGSGRRFGPKQSGAVLRVSWGCFTFQKHGADPGIEMHQLSVSSAPDIVYSRPVGRDMEFNAFIKIIRNVTGD